MLAKGMVALYGSVGACEKIKYPLTDRVFIVWRLI